MGRKVEKRIFRIATFKHDSIWILDNNGQSMSSGSFFCLVKERTAKENKESFFMGRNLHMLSTHAAPSCHRKEAANGKFG